MKKTIPFKKQLTFKTNVSEITSISLEHTLHNTENEITGDLIINGTYKITETSTQVDAFEFIIPINIQIDEKYILDNIKIDINDFYYEIINNSILEVNIEVLLDNIIEKTIIENKEEFIKKQDEERQNMIEQEKIEEKIEKQPEEKIEERCIEEETFEEPEIKKEIKNLFSDFSDDNEYSTYYVYILREGDNIDTIMTKYGITREILSEYNNIDEIKIGDKIIIPEKNNARN